ncbi:MAG: helix-turn-helix domain-containing protein [Clostridiaceae bacterium]|nr:helix-turn-helix domain-containing protein [Clostridiaceae bacterium]
MNQIKIGKFMSQLRKEKNMTQQVLADKIGVSFKTISKWENGRGMPELSLLKPLSDELGVSINELLSGERVEKERYLDKLEENMIDTIEYSDKRIKEKDKILGISLLVLGFLIVITAISIFPSESSWSAFYSVLGSIISLVGFSRLTKKLNYTKRLFANFGFYIIFIVFLFTLDFVNVKLNNEAPRFSLKTTTQDTTIIYETPFYNVYRFNRDTENEKFVIQK